MLTTPAEIAILSFCAPLIVSGVAISSLLIASNIFKISFIFKACSYNDIHDDKYPSGKFIVATVTTKAMKPICHLTEPLTPGTYMAQLFTCSCGDWHGDVTKP